MPLTLDGLLRQAGECRRHVEILLDIKKDVDSCFDNTLRHITNEISKAENLAETTNFDRIKQTIEILRSSRKIVKEYQECYEKIRIFNEGVDEVLKHPSDENCQPVDQFFDGENTSTSFKSKTNLASSPMEIDFLDPPLNRTAEFWCDMCSRSFKTKQAFATHRKTHDKVAKTKRAYKCEICSFISSRKYNLYRHKISQHNLTQSMSSTPSATMACQPSQKAVAEKSTIIGETISFNQDIPCVLNHDGSLSLIDVPSSSTPTSSMPFCGKSGKVVAVLDVFLPPQTSSSLQDKVAPEMLLQEILEPDPTTETGHGCTATTVEMSHVCNGFTLSHPTAIESIVRPKDKAAENVWKSVNCDGRYCLERGRTCCDQCQTANESALDVIRSLKEKRLLCEGVRREHYEVLIKARDWDGRRQSVSLAAFYGDRLFSIKCDGSKTTTESNRCELCERMSRTMRRSKIEERVRAKRGKQNEVNRILFSLPTYLTDTEKSLKEQLRRGKSRSKKQMTIETEFGQSGLAQSEANLMNTEHVEKELAIHEQVSEKKKRQQRTKATINKCIKRLNNRLDMYKPLIAKAIDYERRRRFKNRLATGIDQNLLSFDIDHGDQTAASIRIE